MKKFDVIVVGAGPAGSTAARHCAINNLSTLLLEKEKLPRFKPCGGGVTLAALNELDFEIPKNIIERECSGLKAGFNDHQNQVDFSSTVAYMVKRDKFDQKLADMAAEAGAELHDSEVCRDITCSSENITVQTDKNEYQGNIVIGADGFFSKVLKKIRGGFDKEEIRYCIITDIPLPEHEVTERIGDFAELQFGFVDFGYAWMFPKRDCISAGIGGMLSHAKVLKHRFKEMLEMWNLRTDLKTKGCFLPVSRFKHDICADRIMLTGDAAGFVDSFSGEGIRFAIISGKIAAETSLACHRKGSFKKSSLKYYQEKCFETFGSRLKQSNKLTDNLFKYPGVLLGEAIDNDDFLMRYLKTLTGELDLTDVIRPLMKMIPRLFLKKVISIFRMFK
ncbi:MAG TPA: NAD(P)/FAD-dependent oxidoreductase [Spirochaetes bacterium]|nr:NAD(P)/FAD-dependent oxidoreductase [Spirochaetota bacterium]